MRNQFFERKEYLVLFLILNILACSFLDNTSKKQGSNQSIKREDPVVIRTDFSNDKAWKKICSEIKTPDKKYGFRAYVDFVDNRKYEGKSPNELKEIYSKDSMYQSLFFFVVDSLSLNDNEKPILCIQKNEKNKTNDRFRVIPKDMWVVENNLSTANILFEEFFVDVDEVGIFRAVLEPKKK